MKRCRSPSPRRLLLSLHRPLPPQPLQLSVPTLTRVVTRIRISSGTKEGIVPEAEAEGVVVAARQCVPIAPPRLLDRSLFSNAVFLKILGRLLSLGVLLNRCSTNQLNNRMKTRPPQTILIRTIPRTKNKQNDDNNCV